MSSYGHGTRKKINENIEYIHLVQEIFIEIILKAARCEEIIQDLIKPQLFYGMSRERI